MESNIDELRIVALSDTHNAHKHVDVPDGDILIHCGDATLRRTDEEAEAFHEWFSKQPHTVKIFVPGNHDSDTFWSGWDADEEGYYVLIDEALQINGRIFYGSPWTPTYGDWNWQLPRNSLELMAKWTDIRGVDVLITHGPPEFINDFNTNGIHCGDATLTHALLRDQPMYHFFGHIHEGYGVMSTMHTVCFNVAILDENYRLANAPTVVEI